MSYLKLLCIIIKFQAERTLSMIDSDEIPKISRCVLVNHIMCHENVIGICDCRVECMQAILAHIQLQIRNIFTQLQRNKRGVIILAAYISYVSSIFINEVPLVIYVFRVS